MERSHAGSSGSGAVRDRGIALVLAASGMLTRVIPPVIRSTPFFSDEQAYLSIARDIIRTGTHTGHLFWPAGYAYFAAPLLAWSGGDPRIVLIVQAALSAAVAPIVYILARASGIGSGFAAAGAVLYLILIQPWLTGGLLLSDAMFVTVTTVAVFLVVRDSDGSFARHAAAGLLLGWGWITRQVGALAFALALVWTVVRPNPPARRRLLALALALAAALPVGAILVRNWRAHHRIFLEANSGMNLWQGNNPGTDLFHWGAASFPRLPGESLNDQQRRAGAEALRYILAHPLRFAGRWIVRLGQIAGPNPGREVIHAFRNRIGLRPIVGIHLLESLLLWSVALGGLAFGLRRERILILCAAYIAIYAAMVASVVAAPRYRLPILPFACVLFANGLQHGFSLRRGGSARLPAYRIWIAVIIVVIVAADIGWLLAREMGKAADPAYLNRWP